MRQHHIIFLWVCTQTNISGEHFGCMSSSVSVFWTVSVTEQHSCCCANWNRFGGLKKGFFLVSFAVWLLSHKKNKTNKKNPLAVPMPNKRCATEKAGPKEDGVLRPEGRDERIHELTPPASIHADEAEIQCESAGERDDGDSRRMMKRLKKWGAK